MNVRKKGENVAARYRWIADVADFRMPIKVTTAENKYEFIYPTTSWQIMKLGNIQPENFKVAENLFYVGVKLNWSYLDPRVGD